MATAEITSGICGYSAKVQTHKEGRKVKLTIESECRAIQALASELTEVDPFQEITFRAAGRAAWRWAQSTATTPPARCRSASPGSGDRGWTGAAQGRSDQAVQVSNRRL